MRSSYTPPAQRKIDHNLNLKRLKTVFEIQNPSNNIACNNHAIKVLIELAPKGCQIVKSRGNLIITKGNAGAIRPYYLAHLDQVHDYAPHMSLHINNSILSARDGNGENHGVGGDDKCGIFLALEMLWSDLPNVSAVFVRDEEVGCKGSAEVPIGWFKKAAFVIQADRNNSSFDVIRDTNGMDCASDEFFDAVFALPACIEHQHREAGGSVTDIGELASRGLNISMINISSGYHHPHSRREIVNLGELQVACDLALQAGKKLGSKRWMHAPLNSFALNYRSNYDTGEAWRWDDDIPKLADYPPTPEREQWITMLEALGFDRALYSLDSLGTDLLEEWVALEGVPQ
jgi:hypothetical protein